nr:hypothetical protein [Tanacetum cinerariifolium]
MVVNMVVTMVVLVWRGRRRLGDDDDGVVSWMMMVWFDGVVEMAWCCGGSFGYLLIRFVYCWPSCVMNEACDVNDV